MKTIRFILTGVLAFSALSTCPLRAEKYAVLISAQFATQDNAKTNSEFWYDLLLTYTTLIDYGYTYENIYVLYGRSSDFDSQVECYQNPYPSQITDMVTNAENIQFTFDNLNTIMTEDDFLFVWYMGHGDRQGGHLVFPVRSESDTVRISDVDMAAMMNTVQNYHQRVFSFMTCFSGGILDDLRGPNTIILTSATFDQVSATGILCDTFHAEYHYYETAALHWMTPCDQCDPVDADASGNGAVSFRESFDYACSNPMRSNPQIEDEGRIAPYTYLDMYPIHVSPDGSGDFPTIQTAISSAIDDNLILLDDGTYTNDYDVTYEGKAIAIWPRSDDPAGCTIDCGNNGGGFIFENGEDSRSILRSVTITNGYTASQGGGIYCSDSSPTIRNCRIAGNHADQEGGGLYLSGSSPALLTCSITGNDAGGNGGGIFSSDSSPGFVSCTVADNTTANSGGGIYVTGSGTPSSDNTIFWDNIAVLLGDQVYLDSGTEMTFGCSDVDLLGVAGSGTANWGDENIFTDPLFCRDLNEDPYTIHSYSPCALDNNPFCGLVGAWPVGCSDLEVGILPVNGQDFYPGEVISYQAWITNNTTAPIPAFASIYASDVASWQIVLFGPLNLTVPPMTTLGPVDLHNQIPPGAPPMTAFICIAANDIHDCYQVTIH